MEGKTSFRKHVIEISLQCVVDGVEYMPSMPAANKKTGKTEVCYVILQALGQIPPMD